MTSRVLFVCLGNICRSPTAEGVFGHMLAAQAPHLKVEIDSAGTAAYHIGSAPDPRSRRAAQSRGIDISGLRARQVRMEDFSRFDLILAMDRENLGELRAMQPEHSRALVQLFLDYAPELQLRDVPDPYYGGADAFEKVLDLATTASQGLLEFLQQRAQQPV
jgi:protein-tyrosine phosphatase